MCTQKVTDKENVFALSWYKLFKECLYTDRHTCTHT